MYFTRADQILADYNPCQYRRDNELVNDFSSCNAYFRCQSEQPFKEICKDGFIFSPDFQGCTRCYSCPPAGIYGIPVPRSCTQYVLCIDGEVTYRECPEGTHWNERISNCDLIEQANCQEASTPPPGPPRTTVNPPTTASTTKGGPPTAPTVPRYR